MINAKGHKLETGWRKIPQSKCADSKCEFFGKPAQQGVCFDRLDATSQKYIESVEKYANARMVEVKSLRKINKQDTDAKWIKYLESHLECCWMNEEFMIQQLIHLRAQVGKLTNRLTKMRK